MIRHALSFLKFEFNSLFRAAKIIQKCELANKALFFIDIFSTGANL